MDDFDLAMDKLRQDNLTPYSGKMSYEIKLPRVLDLTINIGDDCHTRLQFKSSVDPCPKPQVDSEVEITFTWFNSKRYNHSWRPDVKKEIYADIICRSTGSQSDGSRPGSQSSHGSGNGSQSNHSLSMSQFSSGSWSQFPSSVNDPDPKSHLYVQVTLPQGVEAKKLRLNGKFEKTDMEELPFSKTFINVRPSCTFAVHILRLSCETGCATNTMGAYWSESTRAHHRGSGISAKLTTHS
ncbi:hypothetical protein DFH06DRAFT_1143943 [Mycena polygramma]|nr:hypothetical protein DFH06DRAFT_1143943 [Mycena polygramma]